MIGRNRRDVFCSVRLLVIFSCYTMGARYEAGAVFLLHAGDDVL